MKAPKYLAIVGLITAAIAAKGVDVFAAAETTKLDDYQLMRQTIQTEYGNRPIRFVDGNGNEERFWNVVSSRENKEYIVVEKTISTGNGTDHGWYETVDGNRYIIGYNAEVEVGKQTVSYIIWNPESNECDDIAHVIDNGSIR